ncbi:unnamed protein product [Trichogramma brassicae]|uniref:Uncharacterized protein n=1 Tax=Trichogramma brassicae TaxID=86971 RepID=A0A6H5IX35_9HYME|nr:unnamed protein product [Trichogramma brassicae]
MKASIMLEHDSQYATILAFDVKIERDAQELADSLGVKIFQADIIYHLFDRFTEYKEQLRLRKREENKHIAVFPCKLKVLPQWVIRSRDPIVMGVMVEAGIIKEGTPICVPSKDVVTASSLLEIRARKHPDAYQTLADRFIFSRLDRVLIRDVRLRCRHLSVLARPDQRLSFEKKARASLHVHSYVCAASSHSRAAI